MKPVKIASCHEVTVRKHVVRRLADFVTLQLFTQVKQAATQLHPIGLVHVQDFNRRATNVSLAENQVSATLKVFHPAIPARVKELDNLLRLRINASQIRSLERVAAFTSKSEILGLVAPAVLSGADMLDLKGRKRQVTLE
jgi:hypothetical protein